MQPGFGAVWQTWTIAGSPWVNLNPRVQTLAAAAPAAFLSPQPQLSELARQPQRTACIMEKIREHLRDLAREIQGNRYLCVPKDRHAALHTALDSVEAVLDSGLAWCRIQDTR